MANELIAVRDGDFIREPFQGTKTLFVIVFGALFTLAIFQLAFAFQMVVFVVVNLFFYGLCLFLFCRFGILIEPLTALAVLALNFAAVASWKALKTFLDNIALQRQVITDSLTGLYGHRFLTLKLGSIFLHSLQNKTEFCVAMLDADHFKKVNDTYGHDVGNEVLVGITKVMKQHVRRQDIAARFGGEEFAVVLIGTDTKGARECLERMRKAIEDLEFTSEKGKFKVMISSGLVSNQNPGVKNSEDMIKLADKALYEAKTQGRNRVCAA
jgi:diguanylate cyclase (GGDEF)-like protein